jgi:hypothetical protein
MTSVHTTTNSAAVKPEMKLVRRDRVGLFEQGLVSKIPLPLNAATYGDLWLTSSGQIGFSKVKWYNEDWQVSIADVSEVRPATFAEALSCYQGVAPSRLLRAKLGDKRYLVLFLGITHFLSASEKAVGHVPGAHHAGAVAVQAKSVFDNRGAKKRAIEARDTWLRVLTRRVDPATLPLLDASAHE